MTTEQPAPETKGAYGTAVLTHQQVAEILTQRGEPITPDGVAKAERKALKKLRKQLEPTARRMGYRTEPQTEGNHNGRLATDL